MAFVDSAWWYGEAVLDDPGPITNDSLWFYGSVSLIDPGKPNLMVGGAEADTSWQVMKGGTSTPVLRWAVMEGGSEVPLKNHTVN